MAVGAQLWHLQTRAPYVPASKYLSEIRARLLGTLHLLLMILLLLCEQSLCHLFAHLKVVSRLCVFSQGRFCCRSGLSCMFRLEMRRFLVIAIWAVVLRGLVVEWMCLDLVN